MSTEIQKLEIEPLPAVPRDQRMGADLITAFEAAPHRDIDMAPPRTLDWAQCPAVESIPGRVSGAWVFKGTRMPVQTVFLNLEAGMSLREITEVFDVTPEEVKAVLHFASQSLIKIPTFAG